VIAFITLASVSASIDSKSNHVASFILPVALLNRYVLTHSLNRYGSTDVYIYVCPNSRRSPRRFGFVFARGNTGRINGTGACISICIKNTTKHEISERTHHNQQCFLLFAVPINCSCWFSSHVHRPSLQGCKFIIETPATHTPIYVNRSRRSRF
jgi:hypothetical protein